MGRKKSLTPVDEIPPAALPARKEATTTNETAAAAFTTDKRVLGEKDLPDEIVFPSHFTPLTLAAYRFGVRIGQALEIVEPYRRGAACQQVLPDAATWASDGIDEAYNEFKRHLGEEGLEDIYKRIIGRLPDDDNAEKYRTTFHRLSKLFRRFLRSRRDIVLGVKWFQLGLLMAEIEEIPPGHKDSNPWMLLVGPLAIEQLAVRQAEPRPSAAEQPETDSGQPAARQPDRQQQPRRFFLGWRSGVNIRELLDSLNVTPFHLISYRGRFGRHFWPIETELLHHEDLQPWTFLEDGLEDMEEKLASGHDSAGAATRQLPHEAKAETVTFKEVQRLQAIREKIDPKHEYIGDSLAILRVFEQIDEFNSGANASKPILLVGKTGVGKTVLARHIHHASSRSKKAYCREPASTAKAADQSIMKGRWVGYGKGGAQGVEQRTGILEKCKGGTVFVDEIHTASEEYQELLLDILDGNKISSVFGEQGSVNADVRLIFGTNEDLRECVDERKFKHDLWSRMRHQIIEIPLLRDRIEDVLSFVWSKCVEKWPIRQPKEAEKQERFKPFTDGVLYALLTHDWKDNIRGLVFELDGAIERATRAGRRKLTVEDLSTDVRRRVSEIDKKDQVRHVWTFTWQILCRQGFTHGRGLLQRMAELLGVSASTAGRRAGDYDLRGLDEPSDQT